MTFVFIDILIVVADVATAVWIICLWRSLPRG